MLGDTLGNTDNQGDLSLDGLLDTTSGQGRAMFFITLVFKNPEPKPIGGLHVSCVYTCVHVCERERERERERESVCV